MCGLFGILNAKPKKFDYNMFCTLGIANDSRGGDSCGIFIDGHYEYGVDKNKLFQDFFIGNKFLEDLKNCQIALGHCRKASVGKISKETAQPVVIENNGRVEYVLLHNGTISNYQELAEKYIPKENIQGLTDSQVMARIFYHKGYDVLSEYKGAGAFVMADYRDKEPTVFFFKGCSKKSYYDAKPEVERPLFFYVNKGTVVFSSICSYLFILGKGDDVWECADNTLCKFDGEDVVSIKTYDRSSICQIGTPSNKYVQYFDDDLGYFDDYITAIPSYNFYRKGQGKLDGKFILSDYGFETKNGKVFYFWNGTLLYNKFCYEVLKKLSVKNNLEEFNKKNKNLIAYLSYNQVYFKDKLYRKAISPTESEPYTGALAMPFSSIILTICNGFVTNTYYARDYNSSTFTLRNLDASF